MPESSSAADGAPRQRILVVDDEPAIVEALSLLLESSGYEVFVARSASECLDWLEERACSLVLLDMMLPDRSGLDVLKDISQLDSGLPVVMLTAYGTIEAAVEATRLGAANFLTKPWNNSKLLLEIEQTLERSKLREENARLRRQLASPRNLSEVVGKSEAMSSVFRLMEQVAPTGATVLVSGESGTGKEIVARAIHGRSPRARAPFVVVNSESIPDDLIESTLFGHLRGAFPGAVRDRRGCFEVADGGTVFLDEVGSLTPEVQSKLLRVIEEREFVPVGSNRPVRVDVRIIAATNADLRAEVERGRFRVDLFYRLNVIGLALPPLRERLDDVPLLVREFLDQCCRAEKHHFLDADGKSTLSFTAEAEELLMTHDWPGNVRELRNVVERSVVLATTEAMGPELLPPSLVKRCVGSGAADKASRVRKQGESLSKMVERFERKVITEELDKHGYNQTETSKSLRVALSTLNQKIQRLGIEVKRHRTK